MNLQFLRALIGEILIRAINALSIFIFIWMSFLTSNAFGANYYISSNGDDNNSGTSTNLPWKTIAKINVFNFSPGDVISFQRGSVWTGEIVIRNSGILGKPIKLTAYGTGVNPIVRNPGTMTNTISINASYIIIENFLLKDSQNTGIRLFAGSVNNVIRDCEFTNMGSGVVISGSYHLITRNYVHDMTMVINDNAPDNDFGALGFIVNGPNNEISYNRGVNLAAPSYDYGTDGGFIELYGIVDSSYIHHNWVENSMGFFEVGGNPGSAKNVRICYNVAVNNLGIFGVTHISDQFSSDIINFRVENNTIVDIKDYGKYSWSLLSFDSAPSLGNFIFRNNIVMLGRFSYFSNVLFDRDHNLYYFLDGATKIDAVSGTLRSMEFMADPKFVNLQLNNFHLQADSQAINNGIDLGYTKDYDDLPVPTGNAPDIGAYEAPSMAPTVTTLASTSVGPTTATLHGNVTANGLATNAWFEYGTDPLLASSTIITSSKSVGSGTTSQPVNAALMGLTTGTTYYYLVAASNSSGTTKGSIANFNAESMTPLKIPSPPRVLIIN